jgi:hypothetical protein
LAQYLASGSEINTKHDDDGDDDVELEEEDDDDYNDNDNNNNNNDSHKDTITTFIALMLRMSTI